MQHLHNEFADFAPVAIRFELPNPPESADVDQWIVAGLVSELRASPRRPLSDQVRLIPAAPEDMVEYADDVLGNVVKQTPDVATWTEAATLPQLQSCAETGALYAVEVGGQRAGVIAAARDDANRSTADLSRNLPRAREASLLTSHSAPPPMSAPTRMSER